MFSTDDFKNGNYNPFYIYYWSNPSMYKLKQLFECTNVAKLRNTYVMKAFQLRYGL